MTDEPDTPNLSSTVVAARTHLRLPSRPDWIEAAVEYLRAHAVLCGACQESRSGKLMLALHEALSNAILHGNLELASELREQGDNAFAQALAARTADPLLSARVVDVLVDYDGERCQWVITDQGKGFDVDRVLARVTSDDPEVLLSSGRGILIMRTFLDEVKFEANGRRLLLTLLRSSGVEQRDHGRVALHKDLKIVPIRADGSLDWAAAYEAVSRNFSQQGIGLLQSHLAEAKHVLIGITTTVGDPHYLTAEVRHCRAIGGDLFEIGCRFQLQAATEAVPVSLKPLQEVHEAVGAVLERLRIPQVVDDERRAYTRVVYNEPIEIVAGGVTGTQIGYARDLSRGGIAFITTKPLPLEVVLVLLPQAPGPPLRVRAQLVRCVKVKDGFYDVGARFLGLADSRKEPPAQ